MAKITRLPIDVSAYGFTPAQMKFLGEYCTNGFDCSLAFKKAFPGRAASMSVAELRMEGLALANERNMKLAVQQFMSVSLDPYRDTLEAELLTVLRARALYDPGKYFRNGGEAQPLETLERTDRFAIDGVKKSYYGRNAEVAVTEYTLANRAQAIKQLQELLQKGAKTGDDLIPDESKSRVKDILAAAKAGAAAALTGVKAGLPSGVVGSKFVHQSPPLLEDVVIDDDLIVDVPIEDVQDADPSFVQKAKEIVRKQNAGIGVELHPLVAQARELANKRKQ